MLFITQSHYTTWGYRLGVQTHGKLVPFWGSHNIEDIKQYVVGCEKYQATKPNWQSK